MQLNASQGGASHSKAPLKGGVAEEDERNTFIHHRQLLLLPLQHDHLLHDGQQSVVVDKIDFQLHTRLVSLNTVVFFVITNIYRTISTVRCRFTINNLSTTIATTTEDVQMCKIWRDIS